MKIKIRNGRPDEMRLAIDAWSKHMGHGAMMPPAMARAAIERICKRDLVFRVAASLEDDSETVGLYLYEAGSGTLWFVWTLYEERRRGVCRELLSELPESLSVAWLGRGLSRITHLKKMKFNPGPWSD